MVASLALALVFWSTLILAQGERLEKFITVPVEFTATPGDLVLVGDKDKDVRLHLTGVRSDLDTIDPASLRARIDLSRAAAGKQTFVITDQNIRLPKGVQLLDVVPPSIDLTLAKLTVMAIPIKPQLVGRLPQGLKLQSVAVQPEQVTVMAPLDQQQQAYLLTTPIYLEGIDDKAEIFCKVIAPPALQPVDKRWPDVAVTITVTR
jgi:YbbR domain-containing protein